MLYLLRRLRGRGVSKPLSLRIVVLRVWKIQNHWLKYISEDTENLVDVIAEAEKEEVGKSKAFVIVLGDEKLQVSCFSCAWQNGKILCPLSLAHPVGAYTGMGAIWWGTRGTCPPHFFRRGGHNMPCPPHFFLFRFCILRDFKNRSDVCHVLCEELFMLDGRPHIAMLMLKQKFGVVSLNVLVYSFSASIK